MVCGAKTIEELLDSIRTKSGRVCPLECGQGKVDKNGRCISKTCPLGLIRGGDGDCVVRRRPVMRHEVEVEERGCEHGFTKRNGEEDRLSGTQMTTSWLLAEGGSCGARGWESQ